MTGSPITIVEAPQLRPDPVCLASPPSTIGHMINTFEAKAATWDDDPIRRRLAQAIVTGITTAIPWRPDLRLVDVGCGTGLVGLPLAAGARELLGVDLASAMVERFLAKAQSAGLAHVRGEVRDLITTPLPASSVDLAISAMAFHHIPNTTGMLSSVVAALVPGGWLAIADLEAEDGSFHDEPVPHPGFDTSVFVTWMEAAGLADVQIHRVHVMERPDRPHTYPVFLAVGRKA